MTKSNRAGKTRHAQTLLNQTSLQVSDWSNPNTPPTKAGVYEIKPEYTTPHRMYCYWDGANWGGDSQDIDGAAFSRGDIRPSQQVTWRGIVK